MQKMKIWVEDFTPSCSMADGETRVNVLFDIQVTFRGDDDNYFVVNKLYPDSIIITSYEVQHEGAESAPDECKPNSTCNFWNLLNYDASDDDDNDDSSRTVIETFQ